MWNPFNKKKKQLVSVCDGKMLELSEVEDEVFASKSMGDGYAISPSSNCICAPCDGQLVACFPTGHAFGIQSDELEIMIHIGIDTVELNGEGFEVLVKQGDQIKTGQPLVNIDLEKIASKGYDLSTMVIVTSGQQLTLSRLHEDVCKAEVVAVC